MKKENGQAMVEFALVLPILILLLCGIVDFGWIFGNQLVANNACREATRSTAIHYNEVIAGVTTDEQRRVHFQTEAYNQIRADLSTGIFPAITVTLTKIGNDITVSANGNINVLTPFLSTIIGNTYNVDVNCVMRVE